jgi:hypothetical protein
MSETRQGLSGDLKHLFRGFVVALDLRKLILSFIGVVLTIALAGSIIYGFAYWVAGDIGARNAGGDATQDQVAAAREAAIENIMQCPSLRNPAALIHPGTVPVVGGEWDVPGLGQGSYFGEISGTFIDWISMIRSEGAWYQQLLFWPSFLIMFFMIWGYFGGAICRIAAVEVAKEDRIELRTARTFARKKLSGFVMAPLICVIVFAVISAIMGVFSLIFGYLLGDLLGGAGLGYLILAVALIPALIGGFLLALIAFGTVFGFPLFYPAIGAEGTDSFDAISRGFSYVYARPWQYALYQIANWVFGALCIFFVFLIGSMTVEYTFNAAGWFWPDEAWATFQGAINGHVADDAAWTLVWAAWIIKAILWVVCGVIYSYVFSYFFSSQTLLYFLMRKKIDGIDVAEVYEDGGQPDFWEQELKQAAENAEAAKAEGAAKADESSDDKADEKAEESSDDAKDDSEEASEEKEEKPKKKGGRKKKKDEEDGE